MNKIEKAALEDAEIKAALRWPTFEKPDMMDVTNEFQHAWWFNQYSGDVGIGMFKHGQHARALVDNNNQEQGCGGPWYATKLDALKAMRWIIARKYANELLKIDRAIELAKAEGATP